MPANIQDLFPVWNDVSTWNLAALSPITRVVPRRRRHAADREPAQDLRRLWLQDDWAITDPAHAEPRRPLRPAHGCVRQRRRAAAVPRGRASRRHEQHRAARSAFAFRLNDRTVVRGGYGQYFTDVTVNISARMRSWNAARRRRGAQRRPAELHGEPVQRSGADLRTGRVARFCSNAQRAGLPPPQHQQRNRRSERADSVQPPGLDRRAAADRRHDGGRGRLRLHRRPPRILRPQLQPELQPGHRRQPAVLGHRQSSASRVRARSAWSGWRRAPTITALETSFTKRFSNRWQASATYTLGALLGRRRCCR